MAQRSRQKRPGTTPAANSGKLCTAAAQAAVREAQGEAAAARQEVQWLTQQLSALQGGLDGAPASNQVRSPPHCVYHGTLRKLDTPFWTERWNWVNAPVILCVEDYSVCLELDAPREVKLCFPCNQSSPSVTPLDYATGDNSDHEVAPRCVDVGQGASAHIISGCVKQKGTNQNGQLQEEAEEDYLAGTSNGAAPGEEERDGGAHAGGNAWLVDGRWSALRRRGHAAGWLVDPGQVGPLHLPSDCTADASRLPNNAHHSMGRSICTSSAPCPHTSSISLFSFESSGCHYLSGNSFASRLPAWSVIRA